MNNEEHKRKEIAFLQSVGFDITNGYWQEDIDKLRKEFPCEYREEFGYE